MIHLIGDLSPAAFAGLSAAVFLAGAVDALAGGGGLITLPAYLAVGLDPALVLGTNKLSACFGTVVSTVRYHRALRFSVRAFLPAIAASLVGSWLGARLAILVDPSWLRPLLLAALPVIAFLVWSRRDFGAHDASHRLPAPTLARQGAAVSFPVGLYDGFFGPGTGTFFALGFTRWCGYDLLNATARAKILNLVSNLAALAAFAWAGRLDWRLGLTMAGMSVAGNWVGSHLGVRNGAAAIRPVVALVCGGLFFKLLFDTL
ncbi:MAG: TSUP family transporter [Elusimicrobiota bacterium]|nr:TSUP family transporter [Elusimicrobiota bacterium]